MTTAHRPTFDTARGGTGKNEGDLSKLSAQYSSKDMPSHTKLKYRQAGQSTSDDVRGKDMRRELTERERSARRTAASTSAGGASRAESTASGSKKPKLDAIEAENVDADDPVDEDSDASSDDEDETAELMAELARIKKERAQEKSKQDAEKELEEERIRTENLMHGNPLLGQKSDFKVKRRWDDDVVFKNCAKGLDERAAAPSFVNDSIRSEFHKKFMERYVK